MIEIEGITRSFGKKLVLNKISGRIETGKVVGLLGRNGEGKTTLIKILADLIEADSGTATLAGLAPDGSGEIRNAVGYVPERPVFPEHLTIGEVLEWRKSFFRSWNEEKAKELASRFKLDLVTPISGASKGTLGKLAWVCAAAIEPKVFLLDEPLSGLDLEVRDDVLDGFIGELQGEGKTILVATHRMEDFLGTLDEIWVLSGGSIAGKYELEALRKEARRVVARAKNPERLPIVRGGIPAAGDGTLQTWVTLNEEALQALKTSKDLESVQVEEVEMRAVLKAVLSGTSDA